MGTGVRAGALLVERAATYALNIISPQLKYKDKSFRTLLHQKWPSSGPC